MFYSLNLPKKQFAELDLDPDAVYVATLQHARAVKRLELPLRKLSKGVPAVLVGWHATQSNYLGTAFLVDEIVLERGKQRFKLHEGNLAMDARKARAKKRLDP